MQRVLRDGRFNLPAVLIRRSAPAMVVAFLLQLAAFDAAAQRSSVLAVNGGSPGSSPWGRSVRVTDPRLEEALTFLAHASLTANRALGDLRASRLPVLIGTAEQLVELIDGEGGFSEQERNRLLSVPAPNPTESGAAMAWVLFRSDSEPGGDREPRIERVWLVIEADSVESWIRQAGGGDVERRIHHDLLAILAHEFVAHIGSIAATRRLDDLCDDPTPEQRSRSAAALARGDPEPEDGDSSACALRVENRVREEINGVFTAHGRPLLPIRDSYSLESLHFERARRRLYPAPAPRLNPLRPARN